MPHDSVDDFLSGGGPKSLSFKDKPIGTHYKLSPITGIEVNQATDFDTGAPAEWPDGNKVMQLVVTGITDQRDPSVADDDGTRRLFVRQSTALQTAVRAAVKESGEKLAEGGTLVVQFTGEEPNKNPRFNPIKLYAAKYAPPSGADAAAAMLDAAPAPAAQTPASVPSIDDLA